MEAGRCKISLARKDALGKGVGQAALVGYETGTKRRLCEASVMVRWLGGASVQGDGWRNC